MKVRPGHRRKSLRSGPKTKKMCREVKVHDVKAETKRYIPSKKEIHMEHSILQLVGTSRGTSASKAMR